jgi:two-component system response regulator HydG
LVLCRILAEQPYEVEAVQSVASASRMLASNSFDLYLLDYRLQDGSGLEVAEKIRFDGITAPIILISGFDFAEIEPEAARLGIFKFIKKPFDHQALSTTISEALSYIG